MKIKGMIKKLHRLNPNGVLCDAGTLDKLKEGEAVSVSEKEGQQLINMGLAEQIKQKKTKEAKNG
jgi:hypothetical protein|tara:strand:+ start:3567 stop:3761 length:195 start_codon:yes stop_codon:yes gene_type:complete